VTQHLDEDGKPCTRHAPASQQGILALALLGSRMPSFHHDVASKLQSLMMALDEIIELSDSEDLKQTANSAGVTVRELNTLLAANRALSRAPRREPLALNTLLARAAERSGVHVTTNSLPKVDVDVALPSIAHAIAVVLDLAAGPLKLGRNVEIAAVTEATSLVIVVVGPPTAMDTLPSNASEVMALATFALTREGGELRCGTDRFTIRLPLAM